MVRTMIDNYGEMSGYGEIHNYGKSTEYSNSETTTFTFENLEQKKLYEQSNDMNRASFFSWFATGLLMCVSFVIIIVLYIIFIFTFKNAYSVHKIFIGILFIWATISAYLLYTSNNLTKKHFKLRQQVLDTIPNKTE